MKSIVAFFAFLFAFLLMLPAQEEGLVKSSNNPPEQQELIYNSQEAQIPINELNEGGGGYSQYFYYGDPSGMYMNKQFEEGHAQLLDGTSMEGKFRYNIYHQKMQCSMEGDTFAFAKPCELEWVIIGEQKFIYATYVRGDREVSNSWFEVLCEGDCELLLRRYIKYRVTDGDDDNSNDQLYKMEDYYTRKEVNELERLLITKKTILESLIEHQDEVSEYIKAENLKVKEQKDLVKLFAYYNKLE